MAAATMAEAEASFMERRVKNGLDHVNQSRLHDSVADRRDAQRTRFTAARFGNPRSPDGFRLIIVFAQKFVQVFQLTPKNLLKVFHGLSIDARRSFLAQHFAGRAAKVERFVHFVNQRVPLASFHFSVFKCRQHAICPNRWMSPRAHWRCLSGRGSRKWHCDRFVVFTFP